VTCAEVAAAAAGLGKHVPEVVALPVDKQAVAAHHQHAACRVSDINWRTSGLVTGLSVWCSAVQEQAVAATAHHQHAARNTG
jgi:hypothetical protein